MSEHDETRTRALLAEGAVYRGRLLRQPEGYDAEVWEHEFPATFASGSRVQRVCRLFITAINDFHSAVNDFPRVITHADVIRLRSRGLLPPFDADGKLRMDWIGGGRWRIGSSVADFDTGIVTWDSMEKHVMGSGCSPALLSRTGWSPVNTLDESEPGPQTTRIDEPVPEPLPRHVGHWTACDGTIEVWVSPDPQQAVRDDKEPAWWVSTIACVRHYALEGRKRYYVTAAQWAEIREWPEVKALDASPERTYPGLTYVGTAYKTKVYVGSKEDCERNWTSAGGVP